MALAAESANARGLRHAGAALALLAALLAAGCASRRPSLPAPSVPRTVPAIPASAPPLQLDARLREEAVARAVMVINTPYTYGGNTPEGGFDCSGLVQYVFSAAGAQRLPRSTAQWASVSQPVDASQMQRGDLVFFNTSGAAFSHMGIYLGDGKFVHAPASGGTVRVVSLSERYFAQRFMGARSVFAR